jgi:hypothetical protein
MLEGHALQVRQTPEALRGTLRVDWQARAAGMAVLRQAARQWLAPGTVYEIRAGIPEDFGRVSVLAVVQELGMPDALFPYVPGTAQRVGRQEIVYCRERVPEQEARDG